VAVKKRDGTFVTALILVLSTQRAHTTSAAMAGTSHESLRRSMADLMGGALDSFAGLSADEVVELPCVHLFC
jgi:hypothetical protein